MEKICIIGAGGHGREVAEILQDLDPIGEKYELIGFADDSFDIIGKKIMGVEVLGTIDEVFINSEDPPLPLIGIGEPDVKKRIIERLSGKVKRWPTIIHPSSRSTKTTMIGEGCVIFPGCVLSVNVRIGDFVHINTGCSVSHDSIIGDHSIVNPGSYVNGNVNVGNGCYIGSGSVIIQNISIGENTRIGAGAVVIEDIPKNVTAIGVPARISKRDFEVS